VAGWRVLLDRQQGLCVGRKVGAAANANLQWHRLQMACWGAAAATWLGTVNCGCGLLGCASQNGLMAGNVVRSAAKIYGNGVKIGHHPAS